MQNYTALIKSNIDPIKAFIQISQTCSTSLQKQIAKCGNDTNALDQLIIKQKQAALSANLSQIAMQGLYAAGGLFASWAINEGIQLAITALNNYIHRVEIASQKTKDAIQSYNGICSEIETLSSKITELNQEMEGLDPALDSEQLKLLKEETEELSAQLALLKEKQLLAGNDTDQAAQKSLSMKQDSRYQKNQVYDQSIDYLTEAPVKVTKSEELLIAIQKYKEYSQTIAEAKRAQEELEAQGSYSQKEWDRQEQTIQNLSKFSLEVREYANTLAMEIEEQRQGLNGSTQESQELIHETDDAMQQYLNWISSFQTDQIQESAEQMTPSVPLSFTEVLTNLNALTSGFEKLKAIYADIQDQETFDFGSLMDEDFTETFRALDSYKNFVNTIVDSPNNLENCQEAFNQLITEWFDAQAPLEGMTDEAKNASKAMLEQLGIVNAEETVMAALGMVFDDYAAAKQEAADADVNLRRVTLLKISPTRINTGLPGISLFFCLMKRRNFFLTNTCPSPDACFGGGFPFAPAPA